MCPLCLLDKSSLFSKDKRRRYLQCSSCKLVYVEKEFILSQDEEKAIYDLHENNVCDSGYIKFLSRLTEPLIDFLTPAVSGLDFGCGPGPALARMLEEKGFTVSLYDLYYYPEEKALLQKYDFITSTEVVEHVKDSKALFDLFSNCLREKGTLGLMTKLVTNQKAFTNWHYKNDLTHIRFFSRETFEWVAKEWNLKVYFFGNDVIIFTKV